MKKKTTGDTKDTSPKNIYEPKGMWINNKNIVHMFLLHTFPSAVCTNLHYTHIYIINIYICTVIDDITYTYIYIIYEYMQIQSIPLSWLLLQLEHDMLLLWQGIPEAYQFSVGLCPSLATPRHLKWRNKFHPGRLTAGSLQITHEKKGRWSEPTNHGGLVQIIFNFFSWVICRFQPFIFQGV